MGVGAAMWIRRARPARPARPAGPIAPFLVTPVPPGVLVLPVAFLVAVVSRRGVPLAPRLVPRPVPFAVGFVPCPVPFAVGLIPLAAALVPRPVPFTVGFVPCLVPLALGFLVSLLRALCRALGSIAGLLACPGVELPCRPGELLAQGPHGLPDVLGHLAGDVADRGRDLLFKLGKVAVARVELRAALVGDAVNLPAVRLVVRDQALLLEAGQPRVDRAGRRRVHAHEAILQQPDDLVAVPWRLVQQLEQVKAQPAVTEHRAHRPSPLTAAGCAATRLQSGTFTLKHLTLTRYVALPESQDVSRVLLHQSAG